MIIYLIITLFVLSNSLPLSSRILKIAHRGYSSCYIDNSLIAFNKAIENNFDMIEMDIQLSKNNDIVIYHDNYIKDINVKDITTKKLKQKYNIITLDDFFQKINYNNIKINFDVKGDKQEIIEKLLQVLMVYNVNTSLIYISSFNRDILNSIVNSKIIYNMDYKSGFITSNVFNDLDIAFGIFDNIDFVVLDYNILSDDYISKIRRKNVKIFTYTNKNNDTYNIISRYNVDGVYSDCLI
tara:strand:- start:804 stop:1520 length:717 start_codon:yes stop_codon:yes gene_type:complete